MTTKYIVAVYVKDIHLMLDVTYGIRKLCVADNICHDTVLMNALTHELSV